MLTRLISPWKRQAVHRSLRPASTHAMVLSAFKQAENLHFKREQDYYQSSLHKKLDIIFDKHFRVNLRVAPVMKTISMRETLEVLGLAELYRSSIDEHKWLVGIHGASFSSLPAICPSLSAVKQMGSTHNPYHQPNGPVWFFYGDNIRMAMHYAKINAITTEEITGDSQPNYYPHRVALLGFAEQYIIDNMKVSSCYDQANTEHALIAPTMAWRQRIGQSYPDEYCIGSEIRLPQSKHSDALNLPVFLIHGSKRNKPLDEGVHYVQGHICKWIAGAGYIDEETDERITYKKKAV